MKYNAIHIGASTYAVHAGGGKFFSHTKTRSKLEADIEAVKMSARWYRDQMDKCHKELEKLGAVDSDDPTGYLA